jgi:chloramphenicol 3-O-phosphotransferase/integrase
MTSRKIAPPDVLFVNGASSAGKTSLIRAVQDLVPVPYLHVGLDHFFASVPEPWGGGGPGRYSGEGFSYQACESFADALPWTAITVGRAGAAIYAAYRRSLVTLLEQGCRLAIDELLLSDEIGAHYLALLAPYDVQFVLMTARPDCLEERVRGKTYDEARQNWVNLRDQASRGPVGSGIPKLGEFLAYWLREIVEPNLAPKTYEKYEMFSRLHIIPHLGGKSLDKIQVKDVRQWLNKLTALCQCCAQGKDASRPEGKKRCCAVGKCCHETLSASSRKDARNTLHAALTCAVEDETIARNPVTSVKMAKRREPRQRRKRQAWTVDDARWFLESAWHAGEAFYAAFVLVLVLVLGLRRGEVLGLAWDQIDLDAVELYVEEPLQRVRHQLVRREVKTETSEAPLPLPDLCVAALKIRKKQQDADRDRAGDGWIDTGLVFTTRYGTPMSRATSTAASTGASWLRGLSPALTDVSLTSSTSVLTCPGGGSFVVISCLVHDVAQGGEDARASGGDPWFGDAIVDGARGRRRAGRPGGPVPGLSDRHRPVAEYGQGLRSRSQELLGVH